MKLEDILQRFSNDLQAYIAQEVARQVSAGKQNNISGTVQVTTNAVPDELAKLSVARSRPVQSTPNFGTVTNDQSDIREMDYLTSLSQLQRAGRSVQTQDVVDIAEGFSAKISSNGDGSLDELAQLQQGSHRPTVDVNNFPTAYSRVEDSVVSGQNSNEQPNQKPMNGLQLLLNKIRNQKNLSSNQQV